MIVDFHTHTFPPAIAQPTLAKLQGLSHSRPFTDGTQAGLMDSMARAGIDYTLVLPVATHPRQVAHINDTAARTNAQAAGTGVLSLGCIHPDLPGWREELGRVKALGLRGVKLHPVYQGVDFDDVRCLRILDRCGELGLLAVTHAGYDIGFPGVARCTPRMVLRARRTVGDVPLVLAHMGGWRCWDEVEALLAGEDLFLDTSFSLGAITPLPDGYYRPQDLPLMSPPDFLRLGARFGWARILFGTDSPWDDQRAAVDRLKALPLPPDALEQIFWRNALALLGPLPPRAANSNLEGS